MTRVLPSSVSSAPALEGDALDERIGRAAEAGPVPAAVGLEAPSTPVDETAQVAGGALEWTLLQVLCAFTTHCCRRA